MASGLILIRGPGGVATSGTRNGSGTLDGVDGGDTNSDMVCESGGAGWLDQFTRGVGHLCPV
jgi:hypothetical protein